MRYYYSIVDTEFGWLAIVGSDAGLRRLTLPQSGPDKAMKLIADIIPQCTPNSAYFGEFYYRLLCYFEGEKVVFPDALDLRDATPFRKDVWEALRSIPYGETRTYGWVAEKIGRPNSARGVGQALAQNPLPIIVPCHRVLGADGSLAGYRGGLELKQRLLDLESGSK